MVKKAGFFVEVDVSGATMQKKVREGQLAQFNFILVVGEKEEKDGTVNVRLRNNSVMGTKTIQEVLAMFTELKDSHAMPQGEEESADGAAEGGGGGGDKNGKGKAAGGKQAPKAAKAKAAPKEKKQEEK
jgi:threonyl-tRNA synthetase